MFKRQLSETLQYLAVNRKQGKDMIYMHIRLSPEAPESAIDAIQSVAKTRFSAENYTAFVYTPHREMLIVAPVRMRPVLADIDKEVTETWPAGASRIMMGDLSEQSLALLTKVLGQLIGPGDRMLQMAYKRLMRNTNTIIVLDDDPIILRTAEKILKIFGTVIAVDTAEKFFEAYEDQAPNIAFVDIHLRDYKGPPIVKIAREKFDPNIHAVLISSDTAKETVLSVKESGAAGFIVKPFSRDTLFQHLLNAPTFVAARTL